MNTIDLYRKLTENNGCKSLNRSLFVKWVALSLDSMLELLTVACEYGLESELYYLKTGLFSSDSFRLEREAFDDQDYDEVLSSALAKLSDAAKFSVSLDSLDGYPKELRIMDAFELRQEPNVYGIVRSSDRQQSQLLSFISEAESEDLELDSEYGDYLEILYELNDSSFEPEYEDDVDEAYEVIERCSK